jgi:hypothetical protein
MGFAAVGPAPHQAACHEAQQGMHNAPTGGAELGGCRWIMRVVLHKAPAAWVDRFLACRAGIQVWQCKLCKPSWDQSLAALNVFL